MIIVNGDRHDGLQVSTCGNLLIKNSVYWYAASTCRQMV